MACEKIFEDLKKRNLTKIALISGTDAFGKSMRDQCMTVTGKYGIEVLHEETYGPRDSDMTPQLTNIKGKAGVQAVINPGFGQGPAIVTRNYRQLGITHAALPEPRRRLEAVHRARTAAAAEGVRLPAAALLVAEKLPDSDPQKKVVVDYKKTYEAKTGQPVSTFGGHMYDGLMILVEAHAARQERRQGQGARRDREDQGLHRHRRRREHVADRSHGPRSLGLPHAGDQERRLGAGGRGVLIVIPRPKGEGGRARSARTGGSCAVVIPHPAACGGHPPHAGRDRKHMPEFLQFLFSGLTVGAIYALVALGFTLIYNASDVINFAQGEFVMLGGMVTFFAAAAGVPLPLAALLAIVVADGGRRCCLHRLAIEPARGASAVTLIIITIGASIFLRGVAAVVFDKNFHSLPGFPRLRAMADRRGGTAAAEHDRADRRAARSWSRCGRS